MWRSLIYFAYTGDNCLGLGIRATLMFIISFFCFVSAMGYRFVGVVGLLLLLIAIEDWRRLLLAAGPWKVSVVSNSMKFLVMLATVLFSFFSGGKGINKGDERRSGKTRCLSAALNQVQCKTDPCT